MATRTAKLRVELDGEKEYKQAIQELNNGNKVLNSEMKLLQANFQGNEKSMEALTAKSDLLTRQLQQQKDKVSTLESALAAAAKQWGEADSRTQSWQIQLNNARTAEVNLQKALDETNKEIVAQGDDAQESGEKMTTLGDQVAGLAEKFGVHIPDGVKKALDNIDGFSTGTVAAMAAAVAGIEGVKLAIDAVTAGIQAVQKLHEMTLEQAAKADELLTRSAQTGLDTTLLQELDYASKFLDFDGIDKSLVNLTASMGKAVEGAEKQTEAFEKLGVSIYDDNGQLRDSWDVFNDVIDALGTMENKTEADITANALFGKSYTDMKPLIDAGTESLAAFMQEAEDAGTVLTEDQVKILGEVDDAYQKYQDKIDATKDKLAVEFAPISTEVMEKFGDFFLSVGDKIVESGILEKIGAFIEPLGTILEALGTLLDVILPALTPLVEGLATAFGWVADTVSAAVGWLQRLNEEAVAQTMIDVGDMGYNAAAAYNASGTDNWRGGLTWVGESGPELVALPRGSAIHSAQESRQIVSASVDTGRMEALLERNVSLLERISGEFSGLRVKERMAV